MPSKNFTEKIRQTIERHQHEEAWRDMIYLLYSEPEDPEGLTTEEAEAEIAFGDAQAFCQAWDQWREELKPYQCWVDTLPEKQKSHENLRSRLNAIDNRNAREIAQIYDYREANLKVPETIEDEFSALLDAIVYDPVSSKKKLGHYGKTFESPRHWAARMVLEVMCHMLEVGTLKLPDTRGPMGVSKRDAAEILNGDDEELIQGMIKRWDSSRKPFPCSIGFDPYRGNRKLYEVPEMLSYVELQEGMDLSRKHKLREKLMRMARYPDHKNPNT